MDRRFLCQMQLEESKNNEETLMPVFAMTTKVSDAIEAVKALRKAGVPAEWMRTKGRYWISSTRPVTAQKIVSRLGLAKNPIFDDLSGVPEELRRRAKMDKALYGSIRKSHVLKPSKISVKEVRKSLKPGMTFYWTSKMTGPHDAIVKEIASGIVTFEQVRGNRIFVDYVYDSDIEGFGEHPRLRKNPAPVTPEAKQPWQMTKYGFMSYPPSKVNFVGVIASFDKMRGKYRWTDGKNFGFEIPANVHRMIVVEAINQGKPVPPEVLKDYSNLKQANPILETVGTALATGIGLGAGFGMVRGWMKKNPTITRFSKGVEYIGVNVDYPLFRITGDQKVKSITIHRFFGRPYNWYHYKDYYVYSPDIWKKLVEQIEQDATEYKMEVVNVDKQGGYAYLAPIWQHIKKNPKIEDYPNAGHGTCDYCKLDRDRIHIADRKLCHQCAKWAFIWGGVITKDRSRTVLNPRIHPEAIESLKRYKDDLKAGHKDAAEYWRGQAGAYFTVNPKVSVSECPKCHRKLGESHLVITKHPSLATMTKWMDSGIARATDGCKVEPDGECPHGHLSWLRVLGYI